MIKSSTDTFLQNLLEMFGGDFTFGTKILIQKDEDGSDDTEECTETQNDKVSYTFREWWITTKEGILSIVTEEGW